MKLPESIQHTIEVIGLITALLVDIVVIPICMITIAPDYLTKAAFICIGITIVFSVFLSWAKGQRTAWVVFAAVVFFFDLSFALVATNLQTQKIEASTDTETSRIDGEILKAQVQIEKLRDERTISTRPETIASISADIKNEEARRDAYGIERKERESELQETGGIYITADSVFNAIPDAITGERYIPLIVFALIFLALQAVVITSIDTPNKKAAEIPIANPLEKEKPVKTYQRYRAMALEVWIELMWIGEKREPKDLRLPPIETVKQWCTRTGYKFDDKEHAERLATAKKLGLISDTNRLLVSQSKAREAMKDGDKQPELF